MAAGKPHLVRKSRFLVKSTDAKKPRKKSPSNEQEVACSHTNTNESNFNQENPVNSKSIQANPTQSILHKPIQSHVDVKVIHIDRSTAKLDTNNNDKDNNNDRPKTTANTGIFNKISSIWTKRNENTASDATHKQQNDKNQSDNIVKSLKKLFKD